MNYAFNIKTVRIVFWSLCSQYAAHPGSQRDCHQCARCDERFQAEEAMRRSQELLTKVFQSVPIVIGISTAKEGRLLNVNDYGLSWSGYQAHELIGHLTSEIAIWPTPLRNEETVQKALREHGVLHGLETTWKTNPATCGIWLFP